ncbi:MAG: multidrug ABC transporter, partial [Lachnospiraceae bacterium]|nr:multidrug ABC transporter [Lachnospiraceae bacterium]
MSIYLIVVLVSVTIAAFSQILLKKAASKSYSSVLREYVNPYVIGGYGLLFLSLFLTMFSYRGLDFTSVP